MNCRQNNRCLHCYSFIFHICEGYCTTWSNDEKQLKWNEEQLHIQQFNILKFGQQHNFVSDTNSCLARLTLVFNFQLFFSQIPAVLSSFQVPTHLWTIWEVLPHHLSEWTNWHGFGKLHYLKNNTFNTTPCGFRPEYQKLKMQIELRDCSFGRL